MIFASPTFILEDPSSLVCGVEMLRKIERIARISHRTETKQAIDSWERFIRAVVLEHGDWSVVEHSSMTVTFHVNRGVTHEMVRHRLFGFTQESTRFVNYAKDGYEAEYIPSVAVKPEDLNEWKNDLRVADSAYRKWLSRGYAPQIARDHLPNALGSWIAITGNLRNWRHAMLMRTSKETHIDFRAVTIPLLELLKERVPLIFDDIEPLRRQIENMRLPR